MTWFRVDDGFYDHPKVDQLLVDPESAGLALAAWTLAGSWCSRYLTDGHVPIVRLQKLAPNLDLRRGAEALCKVGLWRPTDVGYQFADWPEWNLTKAQVEAEREAARVRSARRRQPDSDEVTPTSRRDFTKSSGSIHPSIHNHTLTPCSPPEGDKPKDHELITGVLDAMREAMQTVNPSSRGPQDTPKNRKAIRRITRECKATIDDWRTVIRRQLESVRHDREKWKWLSLTTLGRPDNFQRLLEWDHLDTQHQPINPERTGL